MRKVFLENLPRKCESKINWRMTEGCKVKFIYDNVEGEITIKRYIKEDRSLDISYGIYNIERNISIASFSTAKIKTDIETIYNISKTLKYMRIAKKKGKLRKGLLKYNGITVKKLKSGLNHLGYKDVNDFLRRYNINTKITKKKYDYYDLYTSYKNFYNSYNRFPTHLDLKKKENKLPSATIILNLLREQGMSKDELEKSIMDSEFNFKANEYMRCIEIYKKYCEDNNIIPSCREVTNIVGHTDRWMVATGGFSSYSDFYQSLGFKKDCELTKKEATEIILDMQSKLDRPLMYDDFRNNYTLNSMNINAVRRLWGTMNAMKEDLGLVINQEDMVSKHVDNFSDIYNDLKYICEKVRDEENRRVISVKDIEKHSRLNVKKGTLDKSCKSENTTVREVISSLGYELQKEGRGLVHNFEDGEKVLSSHELEFSKKLKSLGYEYNKDYFRDVKYKDFIPNYSNNMNCDYVIHLDDELLYIEIAGILTSKFTEQYLNNEYIKESSKRKYAIKLKEKQTMLSENNLNYHILFPKDLVDIDLAFKNIGLTNNIKKEGVM